MKTIEIDFSFSAAHFYKQPLWSIEKNQSEFGKCFSDYGHGHDYNCICQFSITNNQQIEKLESILKQIRLEIDHKHLNFSFEYFKNKVPTTENLALWLQERINSELVKDKDSKIIKMCLYETADIWVEIK